MITRRQFGVVTASALAAISLGSCRRPAEPRGADDGRLTARPRADSQPSGGSERELGLDRKRDAILQMPAGVNTAPLPLLVLLHGAGESTESVLRRIGSVSDEAGVAVLAPASRESTWDAVRGGFARDLTFVNRALERVFETVPIDASRIAVGGFSDGATYAVSLGLINGDLFSRVVAFSPGFVVERTPHGRPQIFISHGREDPILPISRCGRPIVARLRERGYDVTFREFDGGHDVPADIARDAIRWMAGA